MKILFLNTFGGTGGAPVAAKRLKTALEQAGHEVRMGVIFSPDQDTFRMTGNAAISHWLAWFWFILERLNVWRMITSSKYLYRFSTGNRGTHFKNHPAVQAADVIHLHWVNFSMLGIRQIAELSRLKPVIWTLHDMWAFTGGCHYSLECQLYTSDCSECFYLKKGSKRALQILKEKESNWNELSISIVTCSKWLARCASQSSLFRNREVVAIGNAIDPGVFLPLDTNRIRKSNQLDQSAFYVLSGAMDFSDERKGMNHLMEAIRLVSEKVKNLHLLTFGKVENFIPGVQFTAFGRITDTRRLVEIYNMADVFVLPSIQDNLPNTVMESMACGIPVVAFDCGGVADMIEHQVNGYLAQNKNVQDLAAGILTFLDKSTREKAAEHAREKICNEFSGAIIAEKYSSLYEQVYGRHKT